MNISSRLCDRAGKESYTEILLPAVKHSFC